MKSSIPQNPCRYAVSSSSLCDAHCCLYKTYTSLGIIKTRNKVLPNELTIIKFICEKYIQRL